jgi:hypothetical protein
MPGNRPHTPKPALRIEDQMPHVLPMTFRRQPPILRQSHRAWPILGEVARAAKISPIGAIDMAPRSVNARLAGRGKQVMTGLPTNDCH